LPEGIEFSRGSKRAEKQKTDAGNLPGLLHLGGERRSKEHRSRASEERAPVDHWITWYESKREVQQQVSGWLPSEAGEA